MIDKKVIDNNPSQDTKDVLELNEKRFKALYECASEAIFLVHGSTFVDCNPATLSIFGCSKDKIIGSNPASFSPKFQPSGRLSEMVALEKINNALGGQPQFFEWKHKRYDGTLFDAEVSLNRLDLEGDVYLQAIVRDITERKNRESETERLAMVANTTSSLVIISNAERKIEWVNDTFTRVTGYSLEEVKGHVPGHILQGPGTNPETIAFISSQLAKGKLVKDVEILNYKKSGQPYWTSLNIQPICNVMGQVQQYIAIENDITQRKKVQIALIERERRFSNLVRQSPMAVIEWDVDLNIVEWNEAAEQIFGYKREEAVGKKAFKILAQEEDYTDIKRVRQQLLDRQGGEKVTSRNITKEGDKIYCNWYNSLLLDDNEHVVGIISMVEEITDKLKSENLLKESEFKFRQIVQNSPVGIYVYEANEKDELVLVDTNPAANDLTGIDNTQFLGMTILEAFPALADTDLPHHYLIAALHGKPWSTDNTKYEDSNITGNFNVVAFQAGARRVAVMFQNITESIRTQNALKQKNDELIKTNIELDRFVYSASHDLRAPISSLLGLIEVMRLENDVDSLGELMDKQKNSLLKLDTFIQDIVNYSRNNRQKIEIERVDFSSVIEEAFDQLRYVTQNNAIKRNISISENLSFYGDKKRIAIVFNNLISNAIKYADLTKQNPFVELSVKKSRTGVDICIADNGAGIDPSRLPRIFDMFYRATERSTGSGIGLYIVKEIVQKLGGNIKVKSEKGVGCTFMISLPSQPIK